MLHNTTTPIDISPSDEREAPTHPFTHVPSRLGLRQVHCFHNRTMNKLRQLEINKDNRQAAIRRVFFIEGAGIDRPSRIPDRFTRSCNEVLDGDHRASYSSAVQCNNERYRRWSW